MSKTHRLFVGNLPPNIIDQELKNEFGSYGSVKEVEVKHKLNPDNEIINTFAFLYIDIDGNSLRQCLQEFKNEKFKGRFLNVTVARENFLDKLKREREEAAAKSSGTPANDSSKNPTDLVSSRPALPVLAAKQAAAQSSSEDSEGSSDEDEPVVPNRSLSVQPIHKKPSIPDQEVDEDGNLLLRKRSKTFLENGKIRIDARSSSGTGAIHVIDRSKKAKKQFDDEKSKEADHKRLESLGKMKDTYNQQKLAIKNALSGVDCKKSNKIVFDVPEVKPSVDNGQNKQDVPTRTIGKPLFMDDNDEDEDYSNDFRVKEQYQGEKGAQLLKLQSRFKNDKRFDMDSKFWEETGGDDEFQQNEQVVNEVEADEDDERKWQYGILESVMGKRIQSEASNEKKNPLQQTMLRYDPTKQDHTKYLAQNKRKQESININGDSTSSSKKTKPDEIDINNQTPAVEVSKDQFYKVNKNLSTSLWQENGQFSLLSMFGTATNDSSQNGLKSAYRENIISQNNTQKTIEDMTNPFKYDSSDDEQEVPEKKKHDKAVAAKKPNETAGGNGKVLSKNGTAVWHETFFITSPDDDRMKEGLKFFMPIENPNDELDVDNRQKEMRNILKKKVKRSIKSALPHGAKPNKRFRKFVRHL